MSARPPMRLVVPIALREVMAELGAEYSSITGQRLLAEHLLNPDVPGHIDRGADWDVAFSNPPYIDAIVAAGLSSPSGTQAFCRTPLAVAVRGDSTAPPRESTEDIANTLLDASRIAITEGGTSGAAYQTLVAALDLPSTLERRVHPMGGGEPMRALLAGAVDVAVLPLTNVASVAGAVAAAVCPIALGVHIDLALCTRRDEAQETHAFVDWLLDDARDAALARHGAHRV